jgi:prepilin signal peptidase PulO-like enzyme (type II secretory pathway)
MVFLILVLTAAVDAYTATIPDGMIFAGMLAITGMQGLYASWQSAAENLRTALLAGVLIWCVNQLWYKFFRHDALGMGDAKWTMLAVACFGTMPALGAWGIGSCIAVLWIVTTRLVRYKVTQVTFGPFLLIGLCGSLYWLRFLGL